MEFFIRQNVNGVYENTKIILSDAYTYEFSKEEDYYWYNGFNAEVINSQGKGLFSVTYDNVEMGCGVKNISFEKLLYSIEQIINIEFGENIDELIDLIHLEDVKKEVLNMLNNKIEIDKILKFKDENDWYKKRRVLLIEKEFNQRNINISNLIIDISDCYEIGMFTPLASDELIIEMNTYEDLINFIYAKCDYPVLEEFSSYLKEFLDEIPQSDSY